MFINHIKKYQYYLISLLIFLYLISSKLIISPFKPITLVLIFFIISFLIIQNLNKLLRLQISFFLIFTYLLLFCLDFKIEKLVFKSCVRGSCYLDYFKENKQDNLKMNILGKNFINDNLEILPLSTYPNKNILGSNENGYWPIFKSDRYGFNNKDKIYESKEISNLIIGDSYAQNSTVNYAESIQGLMNKQQYKTISLGVGGNGPLLNLATFMEYSKMINARNLIYFFTETNDLFYDISVEKKNIILKNYFEKNIIQNLTTQKDQVIKILDSKSSEIYNNYKKDNKFNIRKFLRLFTLPNTRFILNIVNTGEENNYNNFQYPVNFDYTADDISKDSILSNFKIQNKVLELISNTKNNTNLYLVYIPDKKFFLKDQQNKILKVIKEISLKNNFQFINLYDEIELKERKKLFPRNYQHFNELGQDKIAKIIINKINN